MPPLQCRGGLCPEGTCRRYTAKLAAATGSLYALVMVNRERSADALLLQRYALPAFGAKRLLGVRWQAPARDTALGMWTKVVDRQAFLKRHDAELVAALNPAASSLSLGNPKAVSRASACHRTPRSDRTTL